MPAPDLLFPTNTVFAFVSFEGPDAYSRVGALATRVAAMTVTLAELGFETHHFFFGDPALPGIERVMENRLVLHRWGQWLSVFSPGGVYENEDARVLDVTRSLPGYLIEHVVLPALAAGRVPVVVMEEWQTVAAACALAAQLDAWRIRDRVVLLWHANDSHGFHRIDWAALSSAATITTVSRHMRARIRSFGADAFVIPHGIETDLLAPVPWQRIQMVRRAFAGAGVFFKAGAWQVEKGWLQALDAVDAARASGRRVILVGGTGGQGAPALEGEAVARGLRVASVHSERAFAAQLGSLAAADVVSLRFEATPALTRTIFAAADAVLANSVVEPFGLGGLEAMAAGAVVFTGGTGEDYAVPGRNAVVLDTLEALEILERWAELNASDRPSRMRRAARQTAKEYVWPRVAGRLLEVVALQMRRQGQFSAPTVAVEADDQELAGSGGGADEEGRSGLPPRRSITPWRRRDRRSPAA